MVRPQRGHPAMSAYNTLLGDEEAGWGPSNKNNNNYADPSFSFAEKQVRLGFVRKVFGLLSVQLAITAATVAWFTLHTPTKMYVFANPWIFWTSFTVSFVTMLAMGLSEKLRRQWPTNIVLLGVFTLCESVLVGTIAAMYAPQIVLLAVGVTTGVVGGLALFTLQGKIDLTPYSGALFSLFTALFFASIIQMFVHAKVLHLLLCAGGVVMFSVYLVFDLQMLMGGYKYAISPDEHIFACLNLYLDIINLFLYILQLLNSANRD